MKREIANIRVELVSESPEARDYLLDTMVERINKKPPGVTFEDQGTAKVKRAKVSRVRKA